MAVLDVGRWSTTQAIILLRTEERYYLIHLRGAAPLIDVCRSCGGLGAARLASIELMEKIEFEYRSGNGVVTVVCIYTHSSALLECIFIALGF